ncbi:alpha,alpha-trehalose-phosphate synthase (UDP-forming) [Microvirga makkahensis]|uniref:Trehalose-6-phosphate synthase n=1 Tax=Microvirga makkahensis TaxID=1128670 RepID=A0A7X3SNS9_9HYPH|nr:trehalose-6-phosphate synthase [Microvirga makkahensis]MXQ11389.1 trehalose-6-phosphate synthase [Microvirga makkahensis]
MRIIFRFGGIALLVAAIVILAVLPFATSFVEQWARRDVELRSHLVFNSARDQVAGLLASGDAARLASFFERIASDERVLAIGYCDGASLRAPTRNMPPSFSCAQAARGEAVSFSTISSEGRDILVSAFPLAVSGREGHLVVLHDLSYAARRGGEARNYLFLALAGVAFGASTLAALIAAFIMRRWLASIRQALESARAGAAGPPEQENIIPLGQEIRDVLQELESSRRTIDAAHTDWNPDTLRAALSNELSGSEVIVVSNREPYIHNRAENGGISLQIPASGLVSALEPVVRACGGTWVAHGSGTADRETVDANDRVPVPPANPSYTLRRVWLTDEEQDGYYYGAANEGLWPLCHIAFVRPIFREQDWQYYRSVNEKFADAIVAEAKREDPIILVQDYHFALLPRMIRNRLPQATIVTFWHIPWPNAETFGICPWREEIIDGLLGSSILGFHTQAHCNNFLDAVDSYVESRINRETDTVTFGGEETQIRPYPISIEWPPTALEGQQPVEECRRSVRERLGLPLDMRIGVGIERFDYTKGILDRMQAIDALLNEHPEWHGNFSFVQVAAPTRSKLANYRQLQEEAEALAREINERHGSEGYEPIKLLIRHHEPDEVFELFRAADLCIVSSLHDGMNLVAKEFVAARDDEEGVLILSAFAGASRELSEALIVNPYNAHAMGQAINRALTMPPAEQRERMRLMRDQVKERNVYRWAGQMLLAASRLRKRQRIRRLITAGRNRAAANA